jgi:DNA ligase-1
LKLKPAKTLDLVVVAVEVGSGRRSRWLSNLHLAARHDTPEGRRWVMLGKTFKGMTDELLEWQTRELGAREVRRDGHVVHVRPELVVEIAFQELEASPRYPGGVALRFARVKGYRHDKGPDESDTLETVLAMFAAQGGREESVEAADGLQAGERGA